MTVFVLNSPGEGWVAGFTCYTEPVLELRKVLSLFKKKKKIPFVRLIGFYATFVCFG